MSCPCLLVRTMFGAKIRRQAEMVDGLQRRTSVIDDGKEVPVEMLASNLPVIDDLLEQRDRVLVKIQFQQTWKIKFCYDGV